jgi:hypothetical protein
MNAIVQRIARIVTTTMSSTSVNPHPSPLPKGEGIEWNFFLKPHSFVLSPVRGEEKEYISPLIKGVRGIFSDVQLKFLLFNVFVSFLNFPLIMENSFSLTKFKEFIFYVLIF